MVLGCGAGEDIVIGPTRNEAARDWRKFNNDDLHDTQP